MALDSLGFGIGLQAQAKDYSGMVNQSLAAERARGKAEAAARGKAEDEFNKLITSKDFIQQAGNFHKLYKGEASKEITDFFNRALDQKRQDPNNYLPKVIEDFQQTQMKLNNLKQNSDKVFAYERSAADPTKNNNTWFDQDFMQSVNSQDFVSAADWGKVKSRPGLGILFNPETGDFNAEPPMKVTDDEIIRAFSEQRNMMDVSQEGKYIPGAGGRVIGITTKEKVRPEIVENYAEAESNNPAYLTSKAIQWGVDMSDPNWMIKIKDKVKQHVISLSGEERQRMSTMGVASYGGGGGRGGSTSTGTYSYEDETFIPEKYISPSEFLRSRGLGTKNQNWDELTAAINTPGLSQSDKDKYTSQRTAAVKARAARMYNAYVKEGNPGDISIERTINKPVITDEDFTKIEEFFDGKKIKTESIKEQMLSDKQSSSMTSGAIESWLSSYSYTEPGEKQVVSTINVEDISRLKNAPQNFDYTENGQQKTLTSAEFLGIDKLSDGTKLVRFRHNNTIKRYPYSQALAEQIAKKYKVNVSQLNFK